MTARAKTSVRGLILTGARIVGSDHHAVAIRRDRVVAVGSPDTMRRLLPDAAEHDLGGRLLTPAFVDAHTHLIQTGLVKTGLNLHDATSRDDVLDRVAGYASSWPGARIIIGQGWDERTWPQPVPPTRTELDRAAGSIPVYLARVDVHSAVVSSALLAQISGVSGLTGFRDDGLLTREAHHRCRGQLDQLVADDERRAAARAALQEAAQLGVAWVHELGGPHLGPLEDLVRVDEVGAEVGVGTVTYWGELAEPAAIARARSVGARGLAGDLCIDGAIGSRTASLWADYRDADTRGARHLSADQISDHLIACTRAGISGGFHCIGDDAVAAAVDGLRRTADVLGSMTVRAARHRLEHLEMVDSGDLASLADLGVVASVQPGFDAAWGSPGELYEARLGLGRSGTMNPFRSLLRAGVELAFGTDAPVTPLTGWGMVRDAVHHSRESERLTMVEAFSAATMGGHRAAGADRAGKLLPGWRADLAVWDVHPDGLDPLTGWPVLDLTTPLPRCVLTLSAGRVAFAAGELDSSPTMGR